jgi:hypothetical protein
VGPTSLKFHPFYNFYVHFPNEGWQNLLGFYSFNTRRNLVICNQSFFSCVQLVVYN